MQNADKRLWLFLIGCIGTRSLFAYLAKTVSPQYLEFMGWIALLPAFGFFYIWVTGSRKTGPEVFGEKIWWNHLRPIHGALYALFSYFAIQRKQFAWLFLLFDVVFGVISFLWNRFM
jgi:hypothetical protein